MSARRIQRKRTAGWRMPQGAVYVGRPTRWGNPFTVGQTVAVHLARDRRLWQWGDLDGIPDDEVMNRAMAVHAFARWARLAVGTSGFTIAEEARELAGKDLACWCSLDEPCHADVLLILANA